MFTPAVNRIARIVGAVMLLPVILVLAACGGSASANSRIRPTWVNPVVSSSVLTVSLSDIDSVLMTHFRVATPSGQEVFMAYKLAGTYYVRASVCPPCRSQSFSLLGEKLVCDSCGTIFDARTGDGASGACVNYPKASVAFQTAGGKLTVEAADLVKAYNETLKAG